MQPGRPFVFSNLKDGTGVDAITRFIGETGALTHAMGYVPQCNTQIEERLQEMTGRELTIAEINDRIAAIRDNLRELIEQAVCELRRRGREVIRAKRAARRA